MKYISVINVNAYNYVVNVLYAFLINFISSLNVKTTTYWPRNFLFFEEEIFNVKANKETKYRIPTVKIGAPTYAVREKNRQSTAESMNNNNNNNMMMMMKMMTMKFGVLQKRNTR
jgi:hypothetical protein